MSREQERVRRRLEQNPIVECNRIQRKYYPELFSKFAKVKDPRNQSYIDYSTKTMLGTLYYKCIGGISSMQEMTRKFNDDKIVEKSRICTIIVIKMPGRLILSWNMMEY